jgi:hypothetical protein
MYRKVALFDRLLLVLATTLIASIGTGSPPPGKGGGGDGGGGGTSTTSYSIYKLDDAGGRYTADYETVTDVNDVGSIVGRVTAVADGAGYAAFWQLSGGTSALTLLDGGDFGAYGANAINNLSNIVGRGSDGQNTTAFYWASPQAAPILLPAVDSSLFCTALGINDDGIVCGSAGKPTFDQNGNFVGVVQVAVVWRVTFPGGEPQVFGPVELPYSGFDFSRATALNDVDSDGIAEVVGNFGNGTSKSHAVGKWLVQSLPNGTVNVGGAPQMLSVASETGAAEAWGINTSGTACGFFSLDLYTAPEKGTVWTKDGQIVLANPPTVNGWAPNRIHAAYGLNDSGVIVGETYLEGYNGAIVWPSATTTTPVRLSSFLPKRNSPFTLLLDATAINTNGVIVGTGLTGEGEYGFVAVPK